MVIAENSEPAHSFIAHDIRGVLYRNTAGEELVECVNRVIKGYWSIQRPGEATRWEEEDSIGTRVRDRLTPKEMQVVFPARAKLQEKEIALRLGITEQVVKTICAVFMTRRAFPIASNLHSLPLPIAYWPPLRPRRAPSSENGVEGSLSQQTRLNCPGRLKS